MFLGSQSESEVSLVEIPALQNTKQNKLREETQRGLKLILYMGHLDLNSSTTCPSPTTEIVRCDSKINYIHKNVHANVHETVFIIAPK